VNTPPSPTTTDTLGHTWVPAGEACKRLGLRIKWLRSEKQITQDELSERAGMFRTYVSRVEAGRANPTVTMLHQIAHALGVPVGQLFEESPANAPPRVMSLSPRPGRGRVTK
jgi:transcriptional regulator with XRE-family HTH domain